jgi:hypothetical protein
MKSVDRKLDFRATTASCEKDYPRNRFKYTTTPVQFFTPAVQGGADGGMKAGCFGSLTGKTS